MIKKLTLHKYNIDSDDAGKDFFKIRKTMNICKLIKYLHISFKHLDYLVEDIQVAWHCSFLSFVLD